jgi:hypothetical protein
MLRLIAALFKKSDHSRWSDPRNIHAAWAPRTEKLAALVPRNSRVIEFGAGNRVLEQYLDPSCTYVPSDIVERGPGTIVCDLNNRPFPSLGENLYDVALFSGVLEYVRDLPTLLDWLGDCVTTLVLTYAPVGAGGHSPRAMFERAARLRHGWLNHYRDEELRSLLLERGFELVQDGVWEDQRLYVFSR